MDLSKLSDDQISVALKVIASAKKHGINPDFVLPMVQAESGFKPDAFSGKAYGPMQLTPSTAKELGVDPRNVDENIDGGIRYLKGLIENEKLEKDPGKIFAAYNAGPNAEFFKTGNYQDLPDETVLHVTKLIRSYGDSVPSITLEQESQKEQPTEKQDYEDPYGNDKVPDIVSSKDIEATKEATPAETGTVAGAVGAGFGAVKVPVIKFAHKLSQILPGKKISPEEIARLAEKTIVASPAESLPKDLHGGEKWQKSLTGISTPGAQMSKESLDLAKGMQSVIGIKGEPGFTGGTITQGGVILTPRDAAAIQARQSALSGQISPTVSGPATRGLGIVAGSSPVMGGLSMYGLGYGGQEAYQKYQQGDIPGAIKSGVGAAASGLSVIPRMSPYTSALSAGMDINRRLSAGDYTGAAISGLGAAAPFIAPLALGPGGVPIGVAMALGAPAINEMRTPEAQQYISDLILGDPMREAEFLEKRQVPVDITKPAEFGTYLRRR